MAQGSIEIGASNKSWWPILAAVLVLVAGIGSAYFFGYLKGAASCQSIDVDVAKESLEVVQSASRNTSVYTAAQRDLIAELQQQLNEVSNECLQSTMPSDLIDVLNR